jgi:DNA replication protein DnaC
MLNEQTLEKLHSMKLFGMAEAFRTQMESAETSGLSFEERLALLVDQQWTWRENRALARRLRAAKLKERGVIEDINYQHPRQLDRKLMRSLVSSDWVRQHHNILFIGRPVSASRGWPAHWRIRLAATASRFCTSAPPSSFVSWRWRMWTAASGACC